MAIFANMLVNWWCGNHVCFQWKNNEPARWRKKWPMSHGRYIWYLIKGENRRCPGRRRSCRTRMRPRSIHLPSWDEQVLRHPFRSSIPINLRIYVGFNDAFVPASVALAERLLTSTYFQYSSKQHGHSPCYWQWPFICWQRKNDSLHSNSPLHNILIYHLQLKLFDTRTIRVPLQLTLTFYHFFDNTRGIAIMIHSVPNHFWPAACIFTSAYLTSLSEYVAVGPHWYKSYLIPNI